MLFPNLTTDHENHWHGVISEDPAIRRVALDFWARRLDELPGPILFQVTRAQQLQGPWQRIMRKSDPYCRCGERRWLFPANSVHFHAPEDPTPITIGAGKQLALGARGADLYQTQIQVSVGGGYILTHMLPYSLTSKAELAAMGMGVIDQPEVEFDAQRYFLIRDTLRGEPVGRDSLAQLASHLDEERRPINRFVHINVEGAGVLGWVMYQVIRVDLEADTMQVVVSATAQVMDRSSRPQPHICT